MVATWEWEAIVKKLDAARESLNGTDAVVVTRRARLLSLAIDARKSVSRTDGLFYECFGEVDGHHE